MKPILIAAIAAAPLLAACADAPAARAAPAREAELRVMVKLARPSEDAQAIAAQVAAAAGTRVRYVAATSAQWHALALQCADERGCEAAFRRLGGDAAFEAVQRDERKRIVTP